MVATLQARLRVHPQGPPLLVDPGPGLRREGPHHRRPHLLPQGGPGPGPRRAARPRRLGAAHRTRRARRRPARLPRRAARRPTPRCGSTRTARRPRRSAPTPSPSSAGTTPRPAPRSNADDLDPGPSTFARLSYQAELRGDLDEARRLMRLSLEAAGTSASSYAFAAFHLGELSRAAGPAGRGGPLLPQRAGRRPDLPAGAGRAGPPRGCPWRHRRRRARLPPGRAAGCR